MSAPSGDLDPVPSPYREDETMQDTVDQVPAAALALADVIEVPPALPGPPVGGRVSLSASAAWTKAAWVRACG